MPKKKKKSRHPLYPEPGASVLSSYSGMPKLDPPEPLPRVGKLSVVEVIEHISYEGLGFCIYDYISSGKIEDAKLARLWKEARQALQAVVEYLDDVEKRPPKRKRKRMRAVTDVEEL